MDGGGSLVSGKGEEGGLGEGAVGFVLFDGRRRGVVVVECAIDDLNGLLVHWGWIVDAYNVCRWY